MAAGRSVRTALVVRTGLQTERGSCRPLPLPSRSSQALGGDAFPHLMPSVGVWAGLAQRSLRDVSTECSMDPNCQPCVTVPQFLTWKPRTVVEGLRGACPACAPPPRVPLGLRDLPQEGLLQPGGLLAPLALRPRRGGDLTGAKRGSKLLIQGQLDWWPERELSSSLHRYLISFFLARWPRASHARCAPRPGVLSLHLLPLPATLLPWVLPSSWPSHIPGLVCLGARGGGALLHRASRDPHSGPIAPLP